MVGGIYKGCLTGIVSGVMWGSKLGLSVMWAEFINDMGVVYQWCIFLDFQIVRYVIGLPFKQEFYYLSLQVKEFTHNIGEI